MKKFIITTAIFLIAAASIIHAQHTVIGKRAGMMVEGRPFLTDAGVYNSYDLAGSPLGRFEIDSTSRLSAEFGYRRFSLGDEVGNYLSGQTLRMGEPGRAFFEVFYGPDILSHKNSASLGQNPISLTLQRFGVAMAAQSEGGSFRSSLSAEGYIGNQNWEYGDSSRTFMGVERLRLDMGSQVHPFARIGFYIGATLRLDTLYDARGTVHEDRSAQMNLPEFGGSIDLGSEDLPVRGNISMSYASSRFVYTSKGVAGGIPAVDGFGNAPAIVNDSLNFFMMVQGDIPVDESYMFTPGLLFGHTSNSGRERVPDEDNDPINLGDPIPNRNYNLSGIHFGIGTGFRADKYANLYAEYSLAAMSLECGSAYIPQPVTKSRTFHHVSFGASTSLHKYLELPLNITPRIAYFISGSAGAANAVHSDLGPVNIYPGKSKAALYIPQAFLEGFSGTSGFTFGVDGLALEDRLAASFWMTFLSKKAEFESKARGGLELGVSVGIKL